MRIIKNTEKKLKIKVPPSSRVKIDTPEDLFEAHCNFLAVGKRQSGKSVLITNYLRMMKQADRADRILVISPTIASNKALLDSLNVEDDDVFDPDDKEVVEKIINIIDTERDDYVNDIEKQDRWKRFNKMLKSNMPIKQIDPYLFLEFADQNGCPVEPQFKYGHRPVLHLFCDDCQSSALFRNRRFLNFVIRHRHIGGMPYQKGHNELCGAIGCSVYIACQNFKATGGGLPRSIRNNITQMAIVGKSKDEQEMKDIYKSVAGEIDYESFLNAYNYATNEPHGSLVIDLHPKQPHMRFRKNLNEYIDCQKPKT